MLAATRGKPTQQQGPSTATHTHKSHRPQVRAKTKKPGSLPPTTETHCLWCLVTSSRVFLCKIKCNLIPSAPFYTKQNTLLSVTHLPFFTEPCDPAALFLSVHRRFLILSTLVVCARLSIYFTNSFFELTLAGLLAYFLFFFYSENFYI